MEVWKAFESNVVTHSAAHHIMTISDLIEKNGYARITDVAKRLGISRSSASITVKTLKGKGYVEEDENKFLRLSAEGKKLSHTIKANRMLLIKFLRDVLGVESQQAEIDACKMEHLLSHGSGEKLLHFLRFLMSDNPQTKSLLKAFWHGTDDCGGLIESCPVCQTSCLLVEEGKE